MEYFITTGLDSSGAGFLTTYEHVVLQLLGVYALVGIPQAAVSLHDPDTLGSGSVQVSHCVQTHITNTLCKR